MFGGSQQKVTHSRQKLFRGPWDHLTSGVNDIPIPLGQTELGCGSWDRLGHPGFATWSGSWLQGDSDLHLSWRPWKSPGRALLAAAHEGHILESRLGASCSEVARVLGAREHG